MIPKSTAAYPNLSELTISGMEADVGRLGGGIASDGGFLREVLSDRRRLEARLNSPVDDCTFFIGCTCSSILTSHSRKAGSLPVSRTERRPEKKDNVLVSQIFVSLKHQRKSLMNIKFFSFLRCHRHLE